jgi:hypothetical protein
MFAISKRNVRLRLLSYFWFRFLREPNLGYRILVQNCGSGPDSGSGSVIGNPSTFARIFRINFVISAIIADSFYFNFEVG